MIKRLVVLHFLILGIMYPMQTWGQKKNKMNKKEAVTDIISEGRALYEKYSCKSCHGADGVLQGDLTKAYKKYTDAQLQEYISDPRKFNNKKMPVFSGVIAPEEYKALIEFVKYLGKQAESKNISGKTYN